MYHGLIMYIAGTLHKINAETLILGLGKCGITRVSFGCTGIDTPVRSLKDPAIKHSKLQGFFPLEGENLEG